MHWQNGGGKSGTSPCWTDVELQSVVSFSLHIFIEDSQRDKIAEHTHGFRAFMIKAQEDMKLKIFCSLIQRQQDRMTSKKKDEKNWGVKEKM